MSYPAAYPEWNRVHKADLDAVRAHIHAATAISQERVPEHAPAALDHAKQAQAILSQILPDGDEITLYLDQVVSPGSFTELKRQVACAIEVTEKVLEETRDSWEQK